MLLTVGGAGYVIRMHMQSSVKGCTVEQLPQLDADGNYTAFACENGFVATDMRRGVRATWRAWHTDTQSDTHDHTWEHMAYAAPIFEDRRALNEGRTPVAWAVKA